jgi:adenylosuccinate synthase
MYYIIYGGMLGDESKGSVVDYLCQSISPKYVIRYCGAHQCGHRVLYSNGLSHIFSQFGSGTFAGIPTYYGPHCIFELFSWIVEKNHLCSKGIYNPEFYLDKDCLITTVYHRILNRIKETVRLDKHGSCGVGIGETRKYWIDYGLDSIFAKDLLDKSNLLHKLRLMSYRLKEEVSHWTKTSSLLKEFDDFSPEFLYNQYEAMEVHNLNICSPSDLKFNESDNLIFEGSQGLLLDENYGFHPHTTWSTVTPKHAFDFIDQLGLDRKKSQVIGVIRSYMTRHGAGPFPSECQLDIKNDGGTINTPFNGNMRYGLLDMKLLEYSVKIAKPDCLFINCMDEYPGQLYFKEGVVQYLSKNEFLEEVGNICKVGYLGYGPTYLDKVKL